MFFVALTVDKGGLSLNYVQAMSKNFSYLVDRGAFPSFSPLDLCSSSLSRSSALSQSDVDRIAAAVSHTLQPVIERLLSNQVASCRSLFVSFSGSLIVLL